MEALALEPRNCVVIEDAVAGIQAARSAGARAIGFGRTREADLLAAGAEQVVDSLAELGRLLGSFVTAAPLIIDWDNWLQYAAPQVDCARWTAIIPAAGKGARLAYGRPKVLFPLLDAPSSNGCLTCCCHTAPPWFSCSPPTAGPMSNRKLSGSPRPLPHRDSAGAQRNGRRRAAWSG